MVFASNPLPTSGQFRAARALLGLSQEKLATISGTSRRTVVSLESDAAPVSAETKTVVAKSMTALGICFFGDDEMVGVGRPVKGGAERTKKSWSSGRRLKS